jgi:signal transduction histidine kinase
LFRVTDNGPGIPADEMAHIFKEFYRIPSKHGARGTGLGLTICEGLVRAHNGKIWVEPSAQGGCFAFTIPAKPEERPHDNHPGR